MHAVIPLVYDCEVPCHMVLGEPLKEIESGYNLNHKGSKREVVMWSLKQFHGGFSLVLFEFY